MINPETSPQTPTQSYTRDDFTEEENEEFTEEEGQEESEEDAPTIDRTYKEDADDNVAQKPEANETNADTHENSSAPENTVNITSSPPLDS